MVVRPEEGSQPSRISAINFDLLITPTPQNLNTFLLGLLLSLVQFEPLIRLHGWSH